MLSKKSYIGILKYISNIPSDKNHPEGATEIGKVVYKNLKKLGFKLKVYKKKDKPDLFVLQSKLMTNKPLLLISGHSDTVFSLNDFPLKESAKWLYGPGVADMKGGLVSLIYGLQLLQSTNIPLLNIIFTITPDEETGSQIYTDILKRIYKRVDFAMVLEGKGKNWELCNSRRGIALIDAITYGVNGHSGYFANINPNAIEEISNQILKITSLAKPKKGLTLNAGTITGGKAVNVVAGYAESKLDLRFINEPQYVKVVNSLKQISKLKLNRKSKIKILVKKIFPAMEENSNTIKLKKIVISAYKTLKLTPKFQHRNSASDGNLISSLGVGTIDGFGSYGFDIHTKKERVLKESIFNSGEIIYQVIKSFYKTYNI